VETEPTVSDEEFSRFFSMANQSFNRPLQYQQNTYSQIGNNNNSGYNNYNNGIP
jgi:hypothetical protein